MVAVHHKHSILLMLSIDSNQKQQRREMEETCQWRGLGGWGGRGVMTIIMPWVMHLHSHVKKRKGKRRNDRKDVNLNEPPGREFGGVLQDLSPAWSPDIFCIVLGLSWIYCLMWLVLVLLNMVKAQMKSSKSLALKGIWECDLDLALTRLMVVMALGLTVVVLTTALVRLVWAIREQNAERSTGYVKEERLEKTELRTWCIPVIQSQWSV